MLPFGLDALRTTLAGDLLPGGTEILCDAFSESLEVRTATATTSLE